MDNHIKTILLAAKWLVYKRGQGTTISASDCASALLKIPDIRSMCFKSIAKDKLEDDACKPLPDGWQGDLEGVKKYKFDGDLLAIISEHKDDPEAFFYRLFVDQHLDKWGCKASQHRTDRPLPMNIKSKWMASASNIKAKLVGQNQAVDQVANALMRAELFSASRLYKGPKQVFTFMGPPGVGKTMLAEQLATQLDGYCYLRLNMSDYHHRDDASKLIGDAEKYSGNNSGRLTSQAKKHPKTLFLFDEIEKANPLVLNALLSLLDSGKLDDHNKLESVDFSQAIIVFTTNLGRALYIKDKKGLLPFSDEGLSKDMLADALVTFEKDKLGYEVAANGIATLSPEFVSRLSKGELILFRYLRPRNMLQVANRVYCETIKGITTSLSLRFPEQIPEKWLLLLMLKQGRRLDARRLTVEVTNFIEDLAVSTLPYLEGGTSELALKFADITNTPLDLAEKDLKREMAVLLIEDEQKLVMEYEKLFPEISFKSVADSESLSSAMRKQKYAFALIDLHLGKNRVTKEMDTGLTLLGLLRHLEPSLPAYAFSELAEERGLSSDALTQVLDAGGVREVVAKKHVGISLNSPFYDRLCIWIEDILTEQLVESYLSSSKRMVFTSVINASEGELLADVDEVNEENELGVNVLGYGLVVKPQVSFADVAGADQAKRRLMEIVDWLQHPNKLKALGIKMPKGVLLYGKPGTGKTLLAKAIAGESGLPFLAKTGSEFIQSFVGAGGREVRSTFEAAAECAPCILFIDEIDALGSRNSNHLGGQGSSEKEIINQFLACMDGFAAEAGVFVIAATNYPDAIDSALLRPGRFDNKIEVELPNKVGRRAILKIHTGKVMLGSDVDLNEVVRLTPGFSGAKLAQVVKEAGFLALRNECNAIAQSHLLEAVNTLSMGMAKDVTHTDQDDLQRTAYHESGHAVAGYLLEPKSKLVQLTIMPRANALGFAQHEYDESGDTSLTEQELINRVKVLLAGRAAESLLIPDAPRSTGASNDLERASGLIIQMLTSMGMLNRVWQGYSVVKDVTCLPESLMRDVGKYLEQFEQEITELLSCNRSALIQFSDALLEKETLDEASIKDLLHGIKG